MGHGWDDGDTARLYDEHTRRYPGYRERAERLVVLAGIEPGLHVVDLACGTGVTTMEILRRLDGRGRVTAVDGAEALLAVARTRLADTRVTWVQTRGESLDAVIEEPAEAVLCSAAFWQMRWPEAMTAVRSTLRPGGVFAFNLPRQFFPRLFPERPTPPGPSLGDRVMARSTASLIRAHRRRRLLVQGTISTHLRCFSAMRDCGRRDGSGSSSGRLRRRWSIGFGYQYSPTAFCPASTTRHAWQSWTGRSS